MMMMMMMKKMVVGAINSNAFAKQHASPPLPPDGHLLPPQQLLSHISAGTV